VLLVICKTRLDNRVYIICLLLVKPDEVEILYRGT